MHHADWVFAYASAIGNAHINENIPCQDACDVQHFDDFSISIICDGAGSCENSNIGSKKVVEFSLYHFQRLVRKYNWNKSDQFPDATLWHRRAKETLANVKEDLDKFCLSDNFELKSLSCTVIVVISFSKGLLITHIGDGRAGYCSSDLEWKHAIMPFHGELANQTVFITSDIWDDEIIDKYVESKIVTDDVFAFCLLSDGCEKASFECNLYDNVNKTYYDPNKPFDGFFNPNLKILQNLHQEGKTQDDINELWKSFLTSGNAKLRVEPDDKTLILGVRKVQNN